MGSVIKIEANLFLRTPLATVDELHSLKSELRNSKYRRQIRRQKIDEAIEYVGMLLRVVVAIGAVVVGVLETMEPNLLSIEVLYPGTWIGGGLVALLGNKARGPLHSLVQAVNQALSRSLDGNGEDT